MALACCVDKIKTNEANKTVKKANNIVFFINLPKLLI